MAINVESMCVLYDEKFSDLKTDINHEHLSRYIDSGGKIKDNIDTSGSYSKINEINSKDYLNEKNRPNSKPGIVLIAKSFNSVKDIYINVLVSEGVSIPYFSKDDINNREKWYIPHIITAIYDEFWSDSFKCSKINPKPSTVNVLDIIVNPYSIKLVKENTLYYDGFINFIKVAMRKKFLMNISCVKVVGYDMYIGNLGMVNDEVEQCATKSSGVYSIDSIEVDYFGKNMCRDFSHEIYNNNKEASYKIKYIDYKNNIIEYTNYSKSMDRPSKVLLEFFLPGVEFINDIYIETDGVEIKVKTTNHIKFDINIDFPVLKDPITSSFNKDQSILNLEMKVFEIGFRKINLDNTIIELQNDKCPQKLESDLYNGQVEEQKFALPDYKITQSMIDYTLIINVGTMIKDSLRHIYIGNDTLVISFDKDIKSISPKSYRLIFDVSPKKLNCNNSFLNHTKKSLQFTIRKSVPKIHIKAKIGSHYDSLEQIKVLYFEKKYSPHKKGQPSEWVKDCPERTRSLSESSAASYDVNPINGTNGLKKNSSNGNQINRRKIEYFLTSSWPKGILKRSRSTSETAFTALPDNVFKDYDDLRMSDKFESKHSFSSSNKLCRTPSTDSVTYISGLESSLEDLSIEGSPQKRVVFSGIILKEIYKQTSSIVGANNKKEYIKKRQLLNRRIKKGDCDAPIELKKLEKVYKDSQFDESDNGFDIELLKTTNKKSKNRKKKRKNSFPHSNKEDLIFSFDED